MTKTKLYISNSNEPFENLALEEWALKNLDTTKQDYFILYINNPAVVIGRNQNIFQEVNLGYCRKEQIELTRRISGGGTVFHDKGNLNWTHISAFNSKKVNSYEWAAKPIIELLERLGLKAYLTDRNAIEVNGFKLSGQAQFTNRRNILSHGTLLVDSNLANLQGAIEPPKQLRIKSKASPSVRSETKNLSELLKTEIHISDLIQEFLATKQYDRIDDIEASLDTEKLKSHAWIFERSPKFTAWHDIKGETYEVLVEKAQIKAIKNGKGYLLQDNPFLNQTYEKFLIHYS